MTEHSPAPMSHAPRRVFFGPDTAWAESYWHEKPWHAPQDVWQMPFSEFLRSPWRTEVDDWIIRDDLRELRRLESPLRYAAARVWNHFIRRRYNVHLGWVTASDKVKAAMFGLPVQHDLDPVDPELEAQVGYSLPEPGAL